MRIARVLHWIVAIGLIAVTLLGLYGDAMPSAAGKAAADMTLVYALHKTLGVAVLGVALVFAVWLQIGRRPPRPGPVPWDAVLARQVYWALFVAMLILPLSGPALHGSRPGWGFAPILWPFSPYVPGVPRAVSNDPSVAAFHATSWYPLTLIVLAHVLLWAYRMDLRRGFIGAPRLGAARAALRGAWVAGVLIWVLWAVAAALWRA